ncbi:hypothetical protein FK535_26060 [Mycolicibacterium sp. 018/SC-01/001]|uniref:hypothetical protein n=1 Tax=Mycolicibacterium sp. 018/SC-01/001 TaxID=2592069 RepID=UPI00117C61E6|nr:hypothetical protein [Mycolicibacterium sp. 018/SC-01/001]TRW78225.1 hypothetical protein FK535_26060 [Mycolicibacterium sp. 018/SC-01/001]
MSHPAPLTVDPEALAAAGGALSSAAADLPPAPDPFMPTGTDPLSTTIIGQIPAVEGPIYEQLPVVKAQATQTASNVKNAAHAYMATDQRLGGAINAEMQNVAGVGGGLPGAAGGAAGSAGAASSAGGGLSQMMSMPMQMASQMAQVPQQVMGAVQQVPQGIMQGAQQVGQQVQQMVGQFGGAGGQAGGAGGETGSASGVELPQVEHAQETTDGASGDDPGAERAPDADTKDKAHDDAPGRHRAPDDRINL